VLLSRGGEQVSVDELVDAQWPQEPPRSPVRSTHGTIHWLRKALDEPGEPSRIITTPAGYALHISTTP
jgi:DNA-binding SARP family transcriptional activator